MASPTLTPTSPQEHRERALALVDDASKVVGSTTDRPTRWLLEALVHAVLSLVPQVPADPAPAPRQRKKAAEPAAPAVVAEEVSE